MAAIAVLSKLTQRAKQAEEIIAQLKSHLEIVKQIAAVLGSKPEEERVRAENISLRAQIESLKSKLIYAQTRNGVKQRPLLWKKPLSTCIGVSDAPPMMTMATVETNTTVEQEPSAKANKETVQSAEDGKNQPEEVKAKKAKGDKMAAKVERPVDISRLDLRVGKIVSVIKHPEADSLYIEEVDVGEGKLRTVVSGLVKHVPMEQMQGILAVFMCNLKPTKLKGTLSEAMVMCASKPEKVEILLPPLGSQIGDRVTAKGYTGEPDAVMNPKKKIWETVKPDFKTDGNKVASYKGAQLFVEGKGPVVAPSQANTQIA